ncbi:hypothetical protein [Mesorhizobium sp. Cs1299R1N3]|uniref:hypothetical protein n=1 Tax=Mesorhizobium sp. Cs1299R1N3 TaxID=3015173 RepID=UPI00301E0F76
MPCSKTVNPQKHVWRSETVLSSAGGTGSMAAQSEMTLREAIGFLVSRGDRQRDERRIEMATKLAQFPFVRELEGSSGAHSLRSISATSVSSPPRRWIAHGDALLFRGSPDPTT